MTRWVGLNLIVMGLSIVQRTRLTIALNFKLQAWISLVSVLIAGCFGIIAAYKGLGVWALVFQTLISNIIQTILLWICSKWHPSIKYSWQSFRILFSFGSKLLTSSLIQTIYTNLYSLVIGRFYNATDVGLYNRAYTISQYPSSNLTQVITRVTYPLQCERQGEKEWLVNSFVEFLRLSCLIIFPILTFVAISSKELVTLILTDKWLACAPLVSILCIAYMWIPIGTLNNHIILCQGESGKFLKAEILKKAVAILILIFTLPFGIHILCWGLVLYNIID
ncbi:MAG: lipopolysaccharide biosynthesis protein, partial [Allobaculum sp.]|nr:lipopolysaccharide biosynthesis protein [Allobaculum sp.]